jgi:hypothetical protein
MSDEPEAREEGFYWVVLGQNPPEIAYWERGEWWLAGDAKPWLPDAVNVVSDKLVFRSRLTGPIPTRAAFTAANVAAPCVPVVNSTVSAEKDRHGTWGTRAGVHTGCCSAQSARARSLSARWHSASRAASA